MKDAINSEIQSVRDKKITSRSLEDAQLPLVQYHEGYGSRGDDEYNKEKAVQHHRYLEMGLDY